MTILAQSLLTLVSSHLVALLLLSVWHNFNCLFKILLVKIFFSVPYFILEMKLLQGLKAGMSWAAMTIVVFLEMLRAVF